MRIPAIAWQSVGKYPSPGHSCGGRKAATGSDSGGTSAFESCALRNDWVLIAKASANAPTPTITAKITAAIARLVKRVGLPLLGGVLVATSIAPSREIDSSQRGQIIRPLLGNSCGAETRELQYGHETVNGMHGSQNEQKEIFLLLLLARVRTASRFGENGWFPRPIHNRDRSLRYLCRDCRRRGLY